jgi:hypothetical protein
MMTLKFDKASLGVEYLGTKISGQWYNRNIHKKIDISRVFWTSNTNEMISISIIKFP